MSGNQSEGQIGPSRPEEEQEFLAANQDVLEDALSYAVSNVIQTRAGGKNGAHAVHMLSDWLDGVLPADTLVIFKKRFAICISLSTKQKLKTMNTFIHFDS